MTKAERQHYAKLAELGCIVCLNEGFGYSPTEIHHLRTGTGIGQKSHYSDAIGLCPQHHRLGGYGVAIHAGQGKFHENYGTEKDLLRLTKQHLGATE
jgi:hypothetical protein